MKGVSAFANQESAIIARVFAGWTCAVKLDSTYTTNIILGHIPSPRGHRVPFFDSDFHGELRASLDWRVHGGRARLGV